MLRSLAYRAKDFGKHRIGPLVAKRAPVRNDLPGSHWNLAPGADGRLALRGTSLAALASEWGTPLHVVDLQRIDADADAAMAPHRAGRGADVFYSYKTNPVPGVLRRLHDRGIGAEVISAYELWLALELGVAPERIIYNGPAKSDESLRVAVRRRVRLVNANSATEVRRIAAIARDEQTDVELGIRVAVPSVWGGQFGIRSGTDHVADTVAFATSAPHVHLTGLHIHRGGTIRYASEWEDHVAAVLAACDEIAASTGWSPTTIDLGGSLACPTARVIPEREFRLNRALATDLIPPDPSDAISVAEASATAAAMVGAHFAAAGRETPALVMEPGRALTASSQLLLTSVIDVKDDVDPFHAVIDAGSNLADPLPHEYHQLFSVDAPGAPSVRSYRLAGPICTPGDVLYPNWRLPRLEPGHVLAIMDTGAYFVPFSNSFSFPQPGIVGVDDDGVHELRRRESFEDLVRRDGSVVSPGDER